MTITIVDLVYHADFVRSALALFSAGADPDGIRHVVFLGVGSLVVKALQLYGKKVFDGKCFPAMLGFEKKVAQAGLYKGYV